MIVVDTNVISEPLRPDPEDRVLRWLADHHGEVALTSITVGELRYGVARLPSGRRRDRLRAAVEALVAGAGRRVLDYDAAAATRYADLRVARESAGRSVSVEDTMIAAICAAGNHAIATRNVRDFIDGGVTVIDPWVS